MILWGTNSLEAVVTVLRLLFHDIMAPKQAINIIMYDAKKNLRISPELQDIIIKNRD